MKQGDTVEVSRMLSSGKVVIYGSGFYVGKFDNDYGQIPYVIKLTKNYKKAKAGGYNLDAFKKKLFSV
jgi:hypothetical protein